MAAITSAGSGNWNSTTPNAPWPSGTVPVSGDTVTIANGHTITIPNGYTAVVGNSPADDTGTPAIQTASATGTGILAIASGGALTYKGPIRQTNNNWTIGSDCVIQHDSSGAGVPATANYTWQIGISGSTSGKLAIAGTAGHRTTFSKATSSGNSGGFGGGGFADCGQINADYATFSDWGVAATYCARGSPISPGTVFTFDNCLFDRCGRLFIGDVRNGADFRFKDSSYRSPIVTSAETFGADTTGNGFSINPVSGDRRIENAYIEGQVSLWNTSANTSAFGFHMVNVVIVGTTAAAPFTGIGAPTFDEWNNVLLYNKLSGGAGPFGSPCGTLTRSILLRSNGNVANPHFIDSVKGPVTWDGFVAEFLETGGDGDLFQSTTRSSAFAVTIKNGLLLPDASGKTPGAFFNHSTANVHNGATIFAPTVTVEHCTWEGADIGNTTAGCGGENNTGRSGLFTSVQSNLNWQTASALGWICKWHNSSTPGAGTYTTCDYNGYWNITGVRYFRSDSDPTEYTNAPGTHDVNGNPNFVDSTRKFLTWAQSVDATVTTWADAMNRFSLAYDDSGSLPSFTISAAYDWIRAGWAPRNTALKGTAHDGTDIGAVEVTLARRSRRRRGW